MHLIKCFLGRSKGQIIFTWTYNGCLDKMKNGLVKNLLTVLIILVLITAAAGCLENDNDNDEDEEILSVEAWISRKDDPDVFFDIKARNLNHDLYDFKFDGDDEEAHIQITIYNRDEGYFWEYDFQEDVWYEYADRAAFDNALMYWNLIDMLVEDIEEKGTSDFTFREWDPEKEQTITYLVSDIRINHDIPDEAFSPPLGAIIVEPGPGPS